MLLLHLLVLLVMCKGGVVRSISRYQRSAIRMRSSHTFEENKSLFEDENRISPYKASTNSKVKMPVIILVNPFLDANVGSVSRNMLNFGLTDLRIVSPECDHLSENAKALAVGSYEVLENAKLFPTLEQCVQDLKFVFASTARFLP